MHFHRLAPGMALVLTGCAAWRAGGGPPQIGPCPLQPPSNVWNMPIDNLPVDASSDDYIATIGPNTGLHPDFGTTYLGAPNGIPYIIVPADQPLVNVSFLYDDESDPGPYPIPPDAPIEGGPNSNGDRHILIVRQGDCRLFELYRAFPQTDGTWHADSGAIFDLNSNALRPDTWTSADAAGLPMLPGLVRIEEVQAGEINHALRFTCQLTRKSHVWPARHHASDSLSAARPPMGQRFRLKASVNIATYPPEVQVILKALKKYGMILADNGGNWFISGVPDPLWNDDALGTISSIKGNMFEAVDVSSLSVNPDSGQAEQCSPGDVDASHDVNIDDLLAVIASWGRCTFCPPDVNAPGGDGQVNINDLLTVINTWGPCS